jgi:predicted amidohydrolase YtcJ
MLERFQAGQEIYAAAGITTAQEGATHAKDLELLQKAAAQKRLFIDVMALPFITEAKEIIKKNPPATFGKYQNRLKLGGIKITSDGSPQGKTAFFTTPYLTGGPSGETDWKGEPSFPRAELDEMVKFVYDQKLQLFIHCNGDAAIDMFLDAHEMAAQDRKADLRTTVIHSQFVRKDQLGKYGDYQIIPSFFTEHCFFFGETHIKNRGRKQAEFLSPMKTALSMGLRCANHTDFNVSPIDQLFVMWTAVNRLSREGASIGADERITPLQALKAITLDGAYMYREEQSKGSIEIGKLADLVILSENPLTVDPMKIKDIRVIETIKEGKPVYSMNQSRIQ